VDAEAGEIVEREGVRAESEEAGEEAGEVFEDVGRRAGEGVGPEGDGGVGYVEETPVGGEVEEVCEDVCCGFEIWGNETRVSG
jgi:hypothetical protein